MNPHEQQERHTAIGDVHTRIDTLAEVVDLEIEEQVREIHALIARLLTAEHAERLEAEQQNHLLHLANYKRLSRITRSVVTLTFYASQLLNMSFWDRMRWTFLGRLPPHFSEFAKDPEAVILSEPAENISESLSQTSEI